MRFEAVGRAGIQSGQRLTPTVALSGANVSLIQRLRYPFCSFQPG